MVKKTKALLSACFSLIQAQVNNPAIKIQYCGGEKIGHSVKNTGGVIQSMWSQKWVKEGVGMIGQSSWKSEQINWQDETLKEERG